LHWGSEGLREYNALYTFSPNGVLFNIYDKRQLVPFAESLLAPGLFFWLPDVNLIGRFGHGFSDTVVPAGQMNFAPLICWESAFPDIIHAQIQRGAQFLVIATDDAWFGESNGTYQHAQIAQMRAIESGEWVLQSASTGISGIIDPMGRWKAATGLDKEAVVAGKIGLPPGSLFARIGPNAVVETIGVVYVVVLLFGIAFRQAARKPMIGRDGAVSP
jgi:apolipoprotein N-acyltransferase